MKLAISVFAISFAQLGSPYDNATRAADMAVVEAQLAYCRVRVDMSLVACLEREVARSREIEELTRLGETVPLNRKIACPYEHLSLSQTAEYELKNLDVQCENEINHLNELIQISSNSIIDLLGNRDILEDERNVEDYTNRMNLELEGLSDFHIGKKTSFPALISALRSYRLALQKQVSMELSGRGEVLRSLLCIQTLQILINNEETMKIEHTEYQKLRKQRFDAMFPGGPSKFLRELSCQRPSSEAFWNSYFP